MIKQTITFTNAFDDEVTEDFYFNFTLLELIEQIEVNGLDQKMQKLINTSDGPGAYLIFKGIVLDAYGQRTDKGGFLKTPDVRQEFESSAAMSDMIISFLQDEGLGIAFINGLLPKDKMDAAIAKAEERRGNPTPGIHTPPPTPPVAPTPIRTPVQQTVPTATDETAAFAERSTPVPQTGAVADMTTSEKRQYTDAELQVLGMQPAEEVFTDEEVLAMDFAEIQKKGLTQRAWSLKSQQ